MTFTQTTSNTLRPFSTATPYRLVTACSADRVSSSSSSRATGEAKGGLHTTPPHKLTSEPIVSARKVSGFSGGFFGQGKTQMKHSKCVISQRRMMQCINTCLITCDINHGNRYCPWFLFYLFYAEDITHTLYIIFHYSGPEHLQVQSGLSHNSAKMIC